MPWLKRISHLNELKMLGSMYIVDGKTDGRRTDGRTENRTPISHIAKAGATMTTNAV